MTESAFPRDAWSWAGMPIRGVGPQDCPTTVVCGADGVAMVCSTEDGLPMPVEEAAAPPESRNRRIVLPRRIEQMASALLGRLSAGEVETLVQRLAAALAQDRGEGRTPCAVETVVFHAGKERQS